MNKVFLLVNNTNNIGKDTLNMYIHKERVVIISAKKISSVLLSAAVLLSLSVMVWSIISNGSSKQQQVDATSPEIVRYVLKSSEGYLAVYKNDDETPIEQFDVPVSTFTEYDRELLKYGIEVYSIDELNKLIEDYTS